MKKFLFILLLIFFSGCSIKQALKHDPFYEKTLKYTQRTQILNSLETKALIDAVYLNGLYKNKFQNPTFLIGVYNDFDNQLINQEFSICLNGQKPVKISSKIPKFILYKIFPFYNSWMNYYLVKFPDTGKPYILEYKSKDWGEVKLIF
ncbi:hypothetical protein [Lebetimonas sp. JS170]|uniref:hypothetical protein n=1 Tax=Lebetimonas sp. JS170 TaxID=990073 RepID=UPI00046798F0|nr:hypothetical protein [Lebetimonas sp. JS170]